MQLYKRGRVWWLRWSEGGQKLRESTGCTDKTAAGLVLRRRERERADPAHHAAHTSTVAVAAVRLLKELEKTCKSPHTYEMYRQKARHVVRLLGDLRLVSISHEDAMRFVTTRETEGAHPHTVHRELTTLRLVLRSAARAKEWTGDTKAIIPRYATKYVPRTRWLTEDELLAVSAHLEPGRAAVLAFAVATSGNFGETFAARRGDIAAAGVTVRGTKRATRKRTVPVMGHTWPLLAYALAWADGEPPALFRPWSNMRRDVAAACRRAGVEPFTSNDLRRTCATWLVKRGVPLELAAKVLGNTVAMLRKVYGQLDAEDVGRLVNERLDRSAGHNPGTPAPLLH